MINTVQSATLDVHRIVAQSASIFERLNGKFVPDVSKAEDKNLIKSRLQKWQDVLSDKRSERILARRLAWDGYDLAHVRSRLGHVAWRAGNSIPTWCKYLEKAVEISADLAAQPRPEFQAKIGKYIVTDDPLPYEDVLFPFVIAAEEGLQTAVREEEYALLSENAHVALARSLLKRLTSISAHCLELEFSIARLARQSALSRFSQFSGSSQKPLYQSFVQKMLGDGLGPFLEEYAVLARLVGTVIELWVTTTTEFLRRLAKDYSLIQKTFSQDVSRFPGPVVEIATDLSDPHNQGRTVYILTFASGMKLVYKPKNLGVEVSFYQILYWLNQKAAFPPFRIFKFLNRGAYGWCEFVDHLPCQTEAEVRRYYQRAGILLAWLYALEATDCHYENIIACGEQPVLIDLETIIHQRSLLEIQDDEDNTESQTLAHEYMWNSVFRTGFLPQWQFNQNGASYDGSGLASSDDQVSIVQVPKWKAVNTDEMHLAVDLYQPRARVNLPHVNGDARTLDGYIEDFILGFRQAYQFILKNRDLLLSADSPLNALLGQSVRYIFRNTSNYVKALDHALHPRYLRDGVERSIALDGMNVKYLADYDTRPDFWAAIESERQSMEILDIPFFKTPISTCDMTSATDQVVVNNHFPQSAESLVRSRLNQLSQDDLEQQTSFIKASLYSRVSRPSGQGDVHIDVSVSQEEVRPLPTSDLVAQAQRIAAELKKHAIQANDGSLSWIALGYIEYAKKYRLQPMDYDLYNGSSGIGVFLAALARVTDDATYREWAAGTLLLLRQHLRNKDVSQKMARRIGLGAAAGVGSLIYALVKVSQFLGEPELLEDAHLAAQLITPELIARDKHLDVARGAAGAVLGLLTLYEATGDISLLTTANACADHLKQKRVASQAGYLVWPNHGDQLLTGILHGTAGYAYALLRLYAHTHRSELREMAEQAIAYENSLFSPEQQNWLVYEGASLSETMTTWCHGAPGIGLARLGSAGILETEETRRDVQVALDTTLELGLTGIDHLCCGNFGRIELLLKASQTSADAALAQKVQQWATHLVKRMQDTGYYYFSPDIPKEVYQPALFTGTTGVGYALLRLAFPQELPSLMLWE